MMRKFLFVVTLVLVAGFLIPEPIAIPVQGASSRDWNAKTFWFEPWGASGVHKGIDIFAAQNTNVLAASHQLLLYRGQLPQGGKVILALGPKWRLHYYAHLSEFNDSNGFLIVAGTAIGKVGDTGNAKGKAPHLHYSMLSLIPLPWRIDNSTQGYKKAFYLDPIDYFAE